MESEKYDHLSAKDKEMMGITESEVQEGAPEAAIESDIEASEALNHKAMEEAKRTADEVEQDLKAARLLGGVAVGVALGAGASLLMKAAGYELDPNYEQVLRAGGFIATAASGYEIGRIFDLQDKLASIKKKFGFGESKPKMVGEAN
jgi:hypothetical protein